jgi:2,3-bisphosphoglycerate-independent phosphoglycerate mutase
MKSIHPIVLVILDGFGYSVDKKYNAIAHARMPHFNAWWEKYPHAILAAAGGAVGLPEGMSGNSEVGHLTIGAGRILLQPIVVWQRVIEDGPFAHNATMVEQFNALRNVGGALHVMGLLSDAGVHADENQIHATIAAAIEAGIKKIVVHPFLDGRDSSPQSAHVYLQQLAALIKHYNNGQIIMGSLHGRFYAMDRDNNWSEIEKSYRVLTEKQQEPYETWEKVLERNYAHNITDEFIPPTQLSAASVIHNGDGIFFCNVRPDRARELTACFVQPNFTHFTIKPLNLTFFITPVEYGKNLPTTVLFPREPVYNTFKDVLAAHNKTIFSIAETQKYAHVTYFFRGENEEPVATETRIMIPSLHGQGYRDHPEMSAREITEAVIVSLKEAPQDFYLINYANADMVGHSGDFDATVKAVECLDVQFQQLYEVVVEKMGGTLYITADHGKAELMYDEAISQPHTAHTNNPVPFIMLKKDLENSGKDLPLTQLAHIAPFILQNMGLPVPNEMEKLE